METRCLCNSSEFSEEQLESNEMCDEDCRNIVNQTGILWVDKLIPFYLS